MPTYSYQCKNKHTVERFRPMSKNHDPVKCDECGEPSKMIFTAGIVSNLEVSDPKRLRERYKKIAREINVTKMHGGGENY